MKILVPLFVWYAACVIAGIGVMKVVYEALLHGEHVRRNFQGRDIPASLGIGFVLLAILEAAAAIFVAGPANAMKAMSLLALVCGFGILGLIDDLVQTREKGGIAGHLKNMGKTGRVSTALIKAIFGVIISFAVVALNNHGKSMPFLLVLMDALIIALGANAVNLLDVKPGRAIKGFTFVIAVIVIASLAMRPGASLDPMTAWLIVPFVLWALASWPYDLGCRAMAGDAGSNVLGAVLGLTLVWELSPSSRFIAFLLLIAYHAVAEIGSISAIIQRVPPLRALDNFGVRLLAPSKKEEEKE